jgi:hypothetical protein
MLALPRCQRTCSVSRRVYKHFPQLLFIFYFVFLFADGMSGVTLKNLDIFSYFQTSSEFFKHCPYSSPEMFYF